MKKILLIVTFFLFLLSNSCIGKKLPVPLTYMEKIDGDSAAIMVTDQGFKIAECRLTNEKKAETTADEIWAIHDVCLDWLGKIIVDDKEHEYCDAMMMKNILPKRKVICYW